MPGKLFIIATPIGNLGDISFRAIEVLKKVDIIAAEDTRITIRLLKEYGVKNELTSFHINNERYKVDKIIEHLNKGSDVALVSDAGTPCISDPGYLLINESRKRGIEINAIPGPSSPIAALSISGLPSERFVFEGFLPKKKGRQTRIKNFLELDMTVILFESPHRLLKTLKDLFYFLGNRWVSVCKEITKINESVFFGKLEDSISYFENLSKIKGEYVLIIAKEGYSVE
tara:strand:- start:634 stop:1320 length:687 start_codon:yes stop_codon:yes gene_type:complete